VEINKTNVYNAPATYGGLGCGKPRLFYEAINQDVEVGLAILVELQNSNVFRSATEFSA
jgi:hypothetical protein